MSYDNDVKTLALNTIDDRVWKSADDHTAESICNWCARFWMSVGKRDGGLHFGGEFQTQPRKFSASNLSE